MKMVSKFVFPLLICILSMIGCINSDGGQYAQNVPPSTAFHSPYSAYPLHPSTAFHTPYPYPSANPPHSAYYPPPPPLYPPPVKIMASVNSEAAMKKHRMPLNFPAICPASLESAKLDLLIAYLRNLGVKCRARPIPTGKTVDQVRQEQKALLFNLLISMQNDDRQMLVKQFCGGKDLWTSQQQYAGSAGQFAALEMKEYLIQDLVEYSQKCVPKFAAAIFPDLNMSAQFNDLALALVEDPIVFDAKNLHLALTGRYLNAETIFDILLSRSKDQVELIQSVYERMFAKSWAQIKTEHKYFGRGKAERNAQGLASLLNNIHGKMVIYLDTQTGQYAQQKCGERCAKLFKWMAARVANVAIGQWKTIETNSFWESVKSYFTVPYRTHTDFINHAAFIFEHLPADDIKYMIVKPKQPKYVYYTMEGLQRDIFHKTQSADPADLQLQFRLLARMWQQLGIYRANPNQRDIIENSQFEDQAKRIMANIERKDYAELNRQLVSHSELDLWNIAFQFQILQKNLGYQRIVEKISKLSIFGKPKPVSYINAIFTLIYENGDMKGKLGGFNEAKQKFNEIQGKMEGKDAKGIVQRKLCLKPDYLAAMLRNLPKKSEASYAQPNMPKMNVNLESRIDQQIGAGQTKINVAINANSPLINAQPKLPSNGASLQKPSMPSSNISNGKKYSWMRPTNWFGGRKTNKMNQSNGQNGQIPQQQINMPKISGVKVTKNGFENEYRRIGGIAINEDGHTRFYPNGQSVKIDQTAEITQNGGLHSLPFQTVVDTKIGYENAKANQNQSKWPYGNGERHDGQQIRLTTTITLSQEEPNYAANGQEYSFEQFNQNGQNMPSSSLYHNQKYEPGAGSHYYFPPTEGHQTVQEYSNPPPFPSHQTSPIYSMAAANYKTGFPLQGTDAYYPVQNQNMASYQNAFDPTHQNMHLDGLDRSPSFSFHPPSSQMAHNQFVNNSGKSNNKNGSKSSSKGSSSSSEENDTNNVQNVQNVHNIHPPLKFKFVKNIEKQMKIRNEMLSWKFEVQKFLLARFVYIFEQGSLEYGELDCCIVPKQEAIRANTKSKECKDFYLRFIDSSVDQLFLKRETGVDVVNKCRLPIYKFYQPIFQNVCAKEHFSLLPPMMVHECETLLKANIVRKLSQARHKSKPQQNEQNEYCVDGHCVPINQNMDDGMTP